MNVLQIVRDERPDDAPLDARTREALRARLVGESTAHRPETVVVDDDVTMPERGRDGGGHVVDLDVAGPVLAAEASAGVLGRRDEHGWQRRLQRLQRSAWERCGT